MDARELNLGINRAQSSLQGFKSFLGKLALGVGFFEIGSHVMKTARELETMSTQLQVFTGSSEKAQFLFKNITDYAKETSFYVKDIMQATTLLMAGGVGSKEAIPIMKKLGDIAPDNTRLGRLAMAYGRVNAKGFMSGQENMMFNRGGWFNPLMQLARKRAEEAGLLKKGDEVTKGSAAEKFVRDAQATMYEMVKHKQFTLKMLDEALEYATSKGGMYYQHQAEQVKTFTGAFSNMLDVMQINAGMALQKLFPIFKELMKAVTAIPFDWLSTAFENLSKSLLYLWSSMKQRGILEAFQDIKKAALEFADGVSQAFGGGTLQGTLDNTASLATILAKLFALLVRAGLALALVVVRIVAAFMDLLSMFRAHKELTLNLLSVLGGLGLTGVLVKLLTVGGQLTKWLWQLNPLLSRVVVNFTRLGYREGIIANSAMLLTRLGRVAQAVFPALLRFSAQSVGAFIGLAGAIAFTGSQLWELWKAYRGSKDAEEDQENLVRRTSLATQKGLIQQKYNFAVEKGDWAAADVYHKTLTDYEGQLSAWDKAHPQKSAPGAFEFQSNPELQAIIKQLEDINGNTGKGTETLDKIAGNTAPKSGVPNDVLKLADMSFRTHFDVIASGITLAAE